MPKKSSHTIPKLTPQKIEELLENTGDMALKRRAGLILKYLEPQPEDRILDVGCGDGYYLHMLSQLGFKLELVGTDFDDAGLKSAAKNLANKHIKLIKGDLMKKLPLSSGYFDKVVMSEVAEHLPQDVKGLREVRRVMKKGGTLCLTVPNHNYPLLWDPVNWVLERLLNKHIQTGFFAGLWANHIRLYTPNQIVKSLTSAGFTIEKVYATTYWCLPFNHHIVNIGARLLHDGHISGNLADSINKFKPKPARKPWFIEIYFKICQSIDKLNDIWSSKSSGVGVFVQARA